MYASITKEHLRTIEAKYFSLDAPRGPTTRRQQLLARLDAFLMQQYYCVILHPTDARVLLLNDGAAWSLPQITIDDGWFPMMVEPAIQAIYDHYGLKVTALRHFCQDDLQVSVFENQDPDWPPPPSSRWVAETDLQHVLFTLPELGPILVAWFADGRQEPPAVRPPWERRGWFAQVQPWIEAQVAQSGFGASQQIEQVKAAWPSSCVLRITTTQGRLCFKADHAKPPKEPQIVAAIARQWPEHVPSIIAIDVERSWMLMRDFGGENLDDLDVDHWVRACSRFAQVQRWSTTALQDWLALGCDNRPLTHLPDRIAQLLTDPALARPQVAYGLTPSEIATLQVALADLRMQCQSLLAYPIPAALVLQDFRPGNTRYAGGTYVYYDWADAVVAHPFFSILRFLDFAHGLQGGRLAPSDEARLREAYLMHWQDYGSMEQLQEAFVLAQPIHCWHQALRWYHELAYIESTSPWGQELLEATIGLLRDRVNEYGPPEMSD